MKMPNRKPRASVSEMQEVAATARTKSIMDALGKVTGTYNTVTLAYPKDHPRSLYKQQKKLLKQMQRA